MPIHSQDLRANALDSFNEALAKYKAALEGDLKAYKFAILHFSHFLELLFKYYVSLAHPLLIYKNPFSKAIHKEQTIGLWEATQFLKNEGKELDSEFVSDLEWIKKLRNDIEHHKFEMDVASVRRTLGRLTQAMNAFNDEIADFEVEDFIEPANLTLFEELADEYQAQLKNAQLEAAEESDDGEAHPCYACGHRDTVVRTDGKFTCKYCKEVDEEVTCCICGIDTRQSEAVVWNSDEADHIDYACDACEARIRSMD
jgi:DNA repair exonuclease SbcCD ATPase subunit